MSWTNLDGSSVGALVPEFVGSVAVDRDGSKLYWTTYNVIRRGELDGTEFETVVMGHSFSLSVPLYGLTLDLRRPGDCDKDRSPHLTDHQSFVTCMSGPDADLVRSCGCADVDRNGRVALEDFAEFQREFLTP